MSANPPKVEFLRTIAKCRKREFRGRLCTSSVQREIRHFHVVVVQWRQKKCTKKRDARAKLLFWLLNLLLLWSARSRRRRRILRSLLSNYLCMTHSVLSHCSKTILKLDNQVWEFLLSLWLNRKTWQVFLEKSNDSKLSWKGNLISRMKFAHVIELTRTLAMKTQGFMGSKFPLP